MSKVCQYYFAPQSPFAYLGHTRFTDITKRLGAQVVIKPVELGKVFSVSGGLPLAKRPPQRQAYRLQELKRWGAALGLDINLQPKYFPVDGNLAASLIIAAQIAHGTDVSMQLTGDIMRAVWAEERNIADADTLIGLACDRDLEGRDLLKSAETASVQKVYEQNTDDAIAANVFGVPWYVVDGEGYWGQDRLDFVERALAA